MTNGGHYQFINEGQIVLDTKTQLLWMRCSLGMKWNGIDCIGMAKTYNWPDPEKNYNIEFSGYSNWRLPTKEELQTLVMCSSADPAIFPNNGDSCNGDYTKPTIFTLAFPDTVMDKYWTKDAWEGNYTYGNYVDFSRGYKDFESSKAKHYVRLVHTVM